MKEAEEYIKDIYITDALKTLTKNIAESLGGEIITKRYYDVISNEKPRETANEIKERIVGKINGRI